MRRILLAATSILVAVSTTAGCLVMGTGLAFAATLPDAPTGVVAAHTGTTTASVTWNAPTNTGSAAIQDYKVYYSANSGTTWVLFNDGTSTNKNASVTVPAGSNLIFRIAAKTSVGEGVASAVSNSIKSGTTSSASGKPAISYSSTTGITTLSFSAPSNTGGWPVTSYTIRYSVDAGTTWVQSATPYASNSANFTALAYGTYLFQSAAVTDYASGAWSSSSSSTTILGPPNAPTFKTVTPSEQQVTVTWTAGTTPPTYPITDYQTQYSLDSGTTWATFAGATSVSTTENVTGLQNGTSYLFQTRALNTLGWGPWSISSTPTTPSSAPDAPSMVTSVVVSDLSAQNALQIAWVAGVSNGGNPVLNYSLQRSSDNGTTWSTSTSVAASSTTATVTGLTGGITYIFKVSATNAAGTSAWSAPSVGTIAVSWPSTPINVAVAIGDTTLTANWSAPANTSVAAITGYVVAVSSVNGTSTLTVTNSTLTATFTGLQNGVAYTTTITAKSAAGYGSTSTSTGITATPGPAPTYPYNLSGAPSADRQVTFNWFAPALGVGAGAVDSYEVQTSSDNGQTWVADGTTLAGVLTLTLSGLSAGVSYVFRVRAHNSTGWGVWSSSSAGIVAATTPSAPQTPSVTISNTTATVTITANSSGYSPLTSYQATCSSANGGVTKQTTGFINVLDVTSLTIGATYVCTAIVFNSLGSSTSSSSSAQIVPYRAASAPTAVTSDAGDSQVTVSWIALISTASAPVNGYVVLVNSILGCTVTTASATSCVVSGLDNGVTYSFQVYAYYATTNGATSAAVLATPRTTPLEPSIVAVTNTGDGTAQVTYTFGWDGGSVATDVDAEFSTVPGFVAGTGTFVEAGSDASGTIAISGLTNGVATYVRVRATNDAGSSPWSAVSNPVTTYKTPDAPSTVTAERVSSNSVGISFQPGADGGSAITDYDFEYSTNPAFTAGTGTFVENGTSVALTQTANSLDNGTAYYFRVRATNIGGNGPWSNVSNSATPYTSPGALVVALVARAASQTLSVTVSEADTGGINATDYDFEYSTNPAFAAGTGTFVENGTSVALSQNIGGLVNGQTYYLRARSTNVAGIGPWSATSLAAIPFATPGAPTVVAALGGINEATVTWNPPTNNGGAPISEYRVTIFAANGAAASDVSGLTSRPTVANETTLVFTGLQATTMYTFAVEAYNAAGYSNQSSLSTPIFAYSSPEQPVIVDTSRTASGEITVTLTDGVTNGADASDYDIEYSTDSTFEPGTGTFVENGTSTSLVQVVGGLSDGTTYYFRVRTTNLAGFSPWSDMSSGTTAYGTPEQPVIVDTSRTASGEITVTLTDGVTNGADASDYDIEYSTDSTFEPGTGTFVENGTSTSLVQVVGGLSDGTTYYFRVRTTNLAGFSPWSEISNSATPFDSPGIPTVTEIGIDTTTVAVTFNAPLSDGGSTIDEYAVVCVSVDGGILQETTGILSSPALVTGLDPGFFYECAVSAHNEGGWGIESTPSEPVLAYVAADAPDNVTAASGDTIVVVSWDAPAENSATPIEGFAVLVDGIVGCVTSDNATYVCTVEGLTNGQQYDFQVFAFYSTTTGATSASVAATPRAAPGEPVAAACVSGTTPETAECAWEAPGWDGGSSVTAYTATVEQFDISTGWFNIATTTTSSTSAHFDLPGSYGAQLRMNVFATNIAGDGETAATSDVFVTTTTPQTAVRDLECVGQNEQTTCTFGAATDNGGLNVETYEYRWSSDNGQTFESWVATTNSSPEITVNGLTNGVAYVFEVRSTNTLGVGPANSARVTPFTTPDAMTVNSLHRFTSGVLLVGATRNGDGGNTITDYEYEYATLEDFSDATIFAGDISIEQTQQINGLIDGVPYFVKARAVNSAGFGAWSDAYGPLAPSALPGAPTVTVTSGIRSVDVTWVAAAGDSDLLEHRITVLDSNGNTIEGFLNPSQLTSLNTTYTFLGLTNGVSYRFVVASRNEAGWGDPSDLSDIVTPYGFPSAPLSPLAISGVNAASITFSAPLDLGGAPLLYYTIVYKAALSEVWTETAPISTTTTTVEPLLPGVSYTFKVRATNLKGFSEWSVTSNSVIPYTVADPPVLNATVTANRTAVVTWTASAFDGFARVDMWSVERDLGTGVFQSVVTTNASTTSASISGLTLGLTPVFRVRGHNKAGWSAWGEVTLLTPVVAAPATPSTITAIGYDKGITITWAEVVFGGTTDGSALAVLVTVSGAQRCLITDVSVTSCTITGLANGTVYQTSVKAIGPGGASVSWNKPVTVSAAPPAANSVIAYRQTGGILVAYNYATVNSNAAFVTIDSVEAQTSSNGGTSWDTAIVVGTLSPITVVPTSWGVAQVVRVRLSNGSGTSGWSVSSNTVTPIGAPAAPTIGVLTAGDTLATVAYTTTLNGGSVVTRVEIQSTTDTGTTWVAAVSKTVGINQEVSALKNGVGYQFRIRAWNAIGSSQWSTTSSSVTPYDAIGVPKLAAVAQDHSIKLSWTPILSTPSRAITGYVVTQGTNNVCAVDVSVRTCVATVASNNVATSFQVRAVSGDRVGALSEIATASARNVVTPYLWPAPALSATIGDESVTVSITPALRSSAVAYTGNRVFVNGALSCQIVRGSSPQCPVLGLTNGTPVQISVAAYAGDTQGPLSNVVTFTPTMWTASAPSGMTARVYNGNIIVTARAAIGVGVVRYQVLRDGTVVGSRAVVSYAEPLSLTPVGSHTYAIQAVGPKGRLGNLATVTLVIAVPDTPDVTVTVLAKGKVVLTAATLTLPVGAAWLVIRDGVVIKRVEITGTVTSSTPVTLALQPTGTHRYQLQLETPNGQSALSSGGTVTVI